MNLLHLAGRPAAAHHIRLVSHIIHRMRDEPPIGDTVSRYGWSRRIPEFEGIRAAVRRHWERKD